MPVPLSEIMARFSPERRAEIDRHAQALIAEHRSLVQIRKALGLTQADVGKALKTSQANVAQIEGKKDLLVSTLARVVKAMGGGSTSWSRFRTTGARSCRSARPKASRR